MRVEVILAYLVQVIFIGNVQWFSNVILFYQDLAIVRPEISILELTFTLSGLEKQVFPFPGGILQDENFTDIWKLGSVLNCFEMTTAFHHVVSHCPVSEFRYDGRWFGIILRGHPV